MNNLPQKSQGRTVMSADIFNILDGELKYSDEVWELLKNTDDVKLDIAQNGEFQARRAGVVLDITKDGYYNSTLCLKDFEKVSTSTMMLLIFNDFQNITLIITEYSSIRPGHRRRPDIHGYITLT